MDDGVRHGAAVDAQAATAATAGQDAVVLQAAGMRDAAVAQATGKREAGVLTTAGQRRVNLIWEVTQSSIALAVVFVTLFIVGRIALINAGAEDSTAHALVLATIGVLSNVLFLVVGFYFGRTNHQKTGGVAAGDEGR